MHHVVLAGFDLAGVDRDGPSRIDDHDLSALDRLRAELGLLLVHRTAAQVRHPMVQEIVGLGFERVGADRNDGVGQFGILVAVVQFAHAHVARGMNFGIVGGPVMDADVLDLHRPEIELARAPGIFVAAAGAAVIEGGDEQAVLAHVIDDRDGHARDQIERIVPAGRLHLPVAPHHRVRQPLQLRVALLRIAHLGHARAAHRAKAGVHDAVVVRLDDDMHVAAVLADDVVHRRASTTRPSRRPAAWRGQRRTCSGPARCRPACWSATCTPCSRSRRCSSGR